ncbi:MAG: phosphoribosylaminoimidazolesuccinocarboxamide synthase [Chloroflexi bacterium]|nr:phosphoribosylaminoimidazolesuccinocarboxamide synthase [Chloroflexota bacterium]
MTTVRETDLPNLFYRGKVRDTYDLGQGLLLMVATDRISAFDVVLPSAIPEKGVVLAHLSAFWFRSTAHLVPNHFVGMATEADRLPELAQEAHLPRLPRQVARRAMVVHRAQRIDIECVVRGYLAGSAWAEYREKGTVHGQPMPRGLKEGNRLPEPLFTPTTKAETGHDLPMSLVEMERMTGAALAKELREKTLAVYRFAHDYAQAKGIIIADTKMEFGLRDGQVILIDELLTPDSSRFWDAAGYQPGQGQPNFDKQFVRDWLLGSGWDREPPAPELPPDVVEKTRLRYRQAYQRLTGQDLPEE